MIESPAIRAGTARLRVRYNARNGSTIVPTRFISVVAKMIQTSAGRLLNPCHGFSEGRVVRGTVTGDLVTREHSGYVRYSYENTGAGAKVTE